MLSLHANAMDLPLLSPQQHAHYMKELNNFFATFQELLKTKCDHHYDKAQSEQYQRKFQNAFNIDEINPYTDLNPIFQNIVDTVLNDVNDEIYYFLFPFFEQNIDYFHRLRNPPPPPSPSARSQSTPQSPTSSIRSSIAASRSSTPRSLTPSRRRRAIRRRRTRRRQRRLF
jgi:hypothetical protein